MNPREDVWGSFVYDCQHPLEMFKRAYDELGKDTMVFLGLFLVIGTLFAVLVGLSG